MSNELSTQAQGQIVAPTQRIQALLQTPQIKARFDEVLGKRAPAFMSSIISAVNSTPALRDCDPMSVISSAAIAAAVDLPINPSLGLAYIVPYKGVAQFQIGWKGFVQLALRSGQYKTINLTPVLEGQISSHNPFTGEMEFDASVTSGKIAGYLLYFKLLNGYEKYFYMTRADCEAHGKKYSATFKKGFGVWVDNFDAMALKTVAKMGLSKYGVLSVEMQKAVEMDQREITPEGEPKYVDIDLTPSDAAAEANKRIREKRRLKNAPGAPDHGTPVLDPSSEVIAATPPGEPHI